MSKQTRRQEIFRMLQDNVSLETSKLSEKFGVSPITIRRDFEFLEEQGLITTIYGGAMVNRTLPDLPESKDESYHRIEEKRKIAKLAASFVKPGQTILLDAGSSIKELAIELLSKSDITVLTHSILAINVLAQASGNIRLISLPGQFQKNSMCFFGAMTMDFLDRIRVDYAFIGVSAFSFKRGGTIPDPDEAYAKKKMAAVADNTVVLAEHRKIGAQSVYTAVALSDVDVLVTGRNDGNEDLIRIADAGVKVMTVCK